MSRLIVEVCAIEEIAPIENADRIERVRVKNWWCVTSKNQFKIGDKVVYVPPDSVITEDLANRWGITKYCPKLPEYMCAPGENLYRIKACRFRGAPSFGTIQILDDQSWPIGFDVIDHYKITKYEPPIKAPDGDEEVPISTFHKYSSIENIGNFPNVFKDGEEVAITEKIHGTNCRLGYVLDPFAENSYYPWEKVAGSFEIQRKPWDAKKRRSKYWLPFKEEGNCSITNLLMYLRDRYQATQSVIVFGEIFGQGIQDMDYGQNKPSFKAFDIAIDGKYLDWEKAQTEFEQFNVEVVPVLYKGPFSMDIINQLVDGPTTICDKSKIRTPFKGREGVVVKPIKERYDPILGSRVILKSISADYHDRRNSNPTEDH